MVCRDKFKNITSFPAILIFLFALMICKYLCKCLHWILHASNQQEKFSCLLKKNMGIEGNRNSALPNEWMRSQHSALRIRTNCKLRAFFYFAHVIYIKATVSISQWFWSEQQFDMGGWHWSQKQAFSVLASIYLRMDELETSENCSSCMLCSFADALYN